MKDTFSLLSFICLPSLVKCWTVRRPATRRPTFRLFSNPSADDDDELFFDDFGGEVIGGGGGGGGGTSPTPSFPGPTTLLQQRIETLQQVEMQETTQVLQNWKQGNWEVRGFGVEYGTTITQISEAAPDDMLTPCIWVGQGNGSVLRIRLGTEYSTQFRLAEENAADLARDGEMSSEGSEEDLRGVDPFAIQQQFSAGNSPVTHLLEYEERYLFTAAEGASIQKWLLNDEEPERPAVFCRTLDTNNQNRHKATVCCLRAIPESSTLVSVMTDGTIAMWDVETGDTVFECRIDPTTEAKVECADCDGRDIYVGTADGSVLAFHVMDLLETAADGNELCPIPHGQWTASEGAVTSIACAGEGTLGRGKDQTTYTVLTGDESGLIKQWEVLSVKSSGATQLEQWPKTSTQRLPKRAHLFEGHFGSVTTIQAVDATKFITNGADGTVRAWNPATGEELFLMEGFETPATGLCALDDLLITNGMKHLVCVNDFHVPPFESGDDITDSYLDSL